MFVPSMLILNYLSIAMEILFKWANITCTYAGIQGYRDTALCCMFIEGNYSQYLKDRAFNSKLFPLQLGTAIYKHTIFTFQYGMLFLTVHVLRKKGIHIPDPQRF